MNRTSHLEAARLSLAEAKARATAARAEANAHPAGSLPPRAALERARARIVATELEDALALARHDLAGRIDASEDLDSGPLENAALLVAAAESALREAHAEATNAAARYAQRADEIARRRAGDGDPAPLVSTAGARSWQEVLHASRAPREAPKPAPILATLRHEARDHELALGREVLAARNRETFEREEIAKRDALRIEHERADRERFAKVAADNRAAEAALLAAAGGAS